MSVLLNSVLPIHIAAGAAALILGGVALWAKKGGPVHRRSGLLFVAAMVVMGVTASVLGLRKGPTDPNVFAALLTAYFAGTGFTAVRPVSAWTRGINWAALIVAATLALGMFAGGIERFNTPGLSPGGVPFRTIGVMSIFVAAVLSVAAVGDIRVLRSGVPRGAPRLIRHLWRMCFALFIAAGSFFSIRDRVASVLPEPFPSVPMRVLPFVVIFGAMFYWLWRLSRRRFAELTQGTITIR